MEECRSTSGVNSPPGGAPIPCCDTLRRSLSLQWSYGSSISHPLLPKDAERETKATVPYRCHPLEKRVLFTLNTWRAVLDFWVSSIRVYCATHVVNACAIACGSILLFLAFRANLKALEQGWSLTSLCLCTQMAQLFTLNLRVSSWIRNACLAGRDIWQRKKLLSVREVLEVWRSSRSNNASSLNTASSRNLNLEQRYNATCLVEPGMGIEALELSSDALHYYVELMDIVFPLALLHLLTQLVPLAALRTLAHDTDRLALVSGLLLGQTVFAHQCIYLVQRANLQSDQRVTYHELMQTRKNTVRQHRLSRVSSCSSGRRDTLLALFSFNTHNNALSTRNVASSNTGRYLPLNRMDKERFSLFSHSAKLDSDGDNENAGFDCIENKNSFSNMTVLASPLSGEDLLYHSTTLAQYDDVEARQLFGDVASGTVVDPLLTPVILPNMSYLTTCAVAGTPVASLPLALVDISRAVWSTLKRLFCTLATVSDAWHFCFLICATACLPLLGYPYHTVCLILSFSVIIGLLHITAQHPALERVLNNESLVFDYHIAVTQCFLSCLFLSFSFPFSVMCSRFVLPSVKQSAVLVKSAVMHVLAQLSCRIVLKRQSTAAYYCIQLVASAVVYCVYTTRKNMILSVFFTGLLAALAHQTVWIRSDSTTYYCHSTTQQEQRPSETTTYPPQTAPFNASSNLEKSSTAVLRSDVVSPTCVFPSSKVISKSSVATQRNTPYQCENATRQTKNYVRLFRKQR